jgi:uncharacterized membrane protein YhaH (DUF805 family)
MIIDTFFTTKGRIGRLSFIFKLIGFLILYAIIIIAVWMFTKSGMAIFITYVITGLLFYISNLCITAQRLHNIGLSGWWQIVPWLFSLAFYALNPDIEQQIKNNTFQMDFIDISAIVVTGIFFLTLLFWPGSRGQNKYDF